MKAGRWSHYPAWAFEMIVLVHYLFSLTQIINNFSITTNIAGAAWVKTSNRVTLTICARNWSRNKVYKLILDYSSVVKLCPSWFCRVNRHILEYPHNIKYSFEFMQKVIMKIKSDSAAQFKGTCCFQCFFSHIISLINTFACIHACS